MKISDSVRLASTSKIPFNYHFIQMPDKILIEFYLISPANLFVSVEKYSRITDALPVTCDDCFYIRNHSYR